MLNVISQISDFSQDKSFLSDFNVEEELFGIMPQTFPQGCAESILPINQP